MQNHRHTEATALKSTAKSLPALFLVLTALSGLATAQTAGTYQATNLISDGSVAATVTDAHFINPWGIADGPAFWINAEGSGLDYVAQADGTIAFTVAVPAASGTGTGSPAGVVFTGTAPGFVLPNGTKASFLFSTLDGTISGWNGKLGTAGSVAQIAINNSATNAKYTDLALLTNADGSYILASNFGQGAAVEVYDSTFQPAKLAGSFTDPNLPANYAPFAVHVEGKQVFVTYALRTSATPPTYDEEVGPGNGLVDVFDTSGNFVARAISGGNLNAPWGVAIAPTDFGIYGGALLVGNFGDGMINAYDPTTYAYRGQVIDGTGKPFAYASLWEIVFGGSPAGAGDANTLYFAAGLTDESHGLFGAIANNTAAGGTPTFGFSASTSATTVSDGSSTQAVVSVAPTNNFSGTVSLACSGLPQAATCSFSPPQIMATASASATSTLTIQTTKKSSALDLPHFLRGTYAAGITAALLLPFGSLLAFCQRRSSGKDSHIRLLGLLTLLLVPTAFLMGCGGSKPVTPPGTSNVTITATSGSITRTTVIALTVQ